MAEDLKVPDFDDIPEVQGMPKGCAWGVFDTGGRKGRLWDAESTDPEGGKGGCSGSQRGCLDLAQVRSPISRTTRANRFYSWPIGPIKTPEFNKNAFVHKVTSYMDSGFAMHGFDDEVLVWLLPTKHVS